MYYKIKFHYETAESVCTCSTYAEVDTQADLSAIIKAIADEHNITEDYVIETAETTIKEITASQKEKLFDEITDDYINRKYGGGMTDADRTRIKWQFYHDHGETYRMLLDERKYRHAQRVARQRVAGKNVTLSEFDEIVSDLYNESDAVATDGIRTLYSRR